MEQPNLKTTAKAKVLDIKSAFVPSSYHGVWRRSLLENKQGKDDTSLVLWMQTQHHHVDIRIPASRPNFPQYGVLEDFAMDELLMLTTQQGFYGVTHVQRNICRWQREVDFQPESRVYGIHYMKAIRVKSTTNLLQYEVDFYDAKALLLDTFVEGLVGGTGLAFDWNLIPETLTKPIVLAGGLTADNVALAIKQAKPYAVDVSGGVEKSKGVKDPTKLAAFMQSVSIQ